MANTVPAAAPLPYSSEQYRTALELIAGMSNTLDELLMRVQCDCDPDGSAVMLDAAALIARYVGATADVVSGGGCIGGLTRWIFGPTFETIGTKGGA